MNYYTSGITAQGYASFLNDNTDGLERIIYITGRADYAPLSGYLRNLWKGHDVDFVHNPFMNCPYEAVINRTLSAAAVFDIFPLHERAGLPSVRKTRVYTVDLSETADERAARSRLSMLFELFAERTACLQSAYLNLSRALRVHDEWERVYISNMDFARADAVAEELCDSLVGDRRGSGGKTVRRFLGAVTPDGTKNFIPDITAGISRRIFLKGRPGSGKSTLLKKVVKRAADSGFDVFVYHCGFDPASIDMATIPELSACVFDSTPPHEHFPTGISDGVIDIYAVAITPGTDEKYAEALSDIAFRYRTYIGLASAHLKAMGAADAAVNDIYREINPDIEKQIDALKDFLR